jgi:hypothetical protein
MKGILVAALFVFSATLAASVGYDISLEQVKETSQLTNSISLSQQLTSRVSLNAAATFTAQRYLDLGRFIDGRNGTAQLSFQPSRTVEMGIDLARSLSTEERYGAMVRDQLDNTTAGRIRFTPLQWLSMDMGLGVHFVDYVQPSGDSTITGSDEGGVTDIDVTVNRSILPSLSGSLELGEHSSNGIQTDTGKESLGLRLNYGFPAMYEGGNLSVTAGAAKQFTTYNDSTNSLHQEDWSHALAVVVPSPFENVSMEISTDWDYSRRYWLDEQEQETGGDVRDRLDRNRSISSSIRYRMLENLDVEMNISRSIDRGDRKRTATGVSTLFDVYEINDDRVFTARVVYTPGHARITFERLINLYRVDTYGTWQDIWGNVYQDNSDRDELREALALNAEIPLNHRVTILAGMEGQRRRTVFLEAEQSANSKVSSTYIVSPGFRYDAGGDWTLSESLKLSADYTTFLFPQSTTLTNLLFRRLVATSSFQRMSGDSTLLGVSYALVFQDQGSFESSVFRRSEEVISSTLTFNLGFHATGSVGITPSYSWEYSRRNFVSTETPALIDQLHHVGLRSTMSLAGGTLFLQATRTFYAGDSRPSYWRANVGLNYQL